MGTGQVRERERARSGFYQICLPHSVLSKENMAEPVSLCVQELTQATFELSGPALQVIKDTLAVFEVFRQESTKPSEAIVSGSEGRRVWSGVDCSHTDTDTDTLPSCSSSPVLTMTTAQRKRKLQEVAAP